ncbi:NAD-dependent epimerase/dehydratase family protein [Fuerstiella marisgermanici]|uniref:dTDP-glucose 4,6-dehydratase n=1 Tax=Fuerstiella marisgermanici TaxID=1891926 RepID=A0A1P8WDM8_9PLAN|nr:NAD(P)-dependent oxidoreductase [Fuerstiella marisgermanici]APZ92149.1 dTDP-glucose 4,6-dehydratase [Fuerstiella marisgermanici]
MSTIAVFGGSGKIGRRAVEMLGTRGHSVRALVHRSAVPGDHVTSVQGNVASAADCAKVVGNADVVIQLATTKEDADTFFDVSLRGTFNILEACRHAKNVRQFILLSGDAAQGIWFYPHPKPINEDAPLAAYPGYYAFSKVMEETMTQQYRIQYGLNTTILRSSWVFEGDDLLNHFSLLKNVKPAEPGHGFGEVPADVLELVRTGQERIPILLDASGNPLTRHIVHIDDVIQAIDRSLENDQAMGRDYNIAAEQPFQYRDAAIYISEKLAVPTVEIPNPQYHPFCIDIARAKQEIGYAPENDFRRMVDRAIEFRKANC